MEGNGQLHAPAALPPGREPQLPNGYEAGWAPEPDWTLCIGEDKDSKEAASPVALPETDTKFAEDPGWIRCGESVTLFRGG
jgi:hypothetical protein